MCGRYTLSTHDGGRIAERFDTRDFPAPASGMLQRFNVCPGEQVLAVDADRRVRPLSWGLRTGRAGAPSPINARAETAATRPLFSSLIADARGRCLVPADGWYEWLRAERRGPRPAPFHHTVDGGGLFAFAGLRARDSVTILTTAPNAVCARLHDRMPVVLAGSEAEALWLDPATSAEEATELLVALEDERVTVAPASVRVNRAGAEGPELLVPEPTLF